MIDFLINTSASTVDLQDRCTGFSCLLGNQVQHILIYFVFYCVLGMASNDRTCRESNGAAQTQVYGRSTTFTLPMILEIGRITEYQPVPDICVFSFIHNLMYQCDSILLIYVDRRTVHINICNTFHRFS